MWQNSRFTTGKQEQQLKGPDIWNFSIKVYLLDTAKTTVAKLAAKLKYVLDSAVGWLVVLDFGKFSKP